VSGGVMVQLTKCHSTSHCTVRVYSKCFAWFQLVVTHCYVVVITSSILSGLVVSYNLPTSHNFPSLLHFQHLELIIKCKAVDTANKLVLSDLQYTTQYMHTTFKQNIYWIHTTTELTW